MQVTYIPGKEINSDLGVVNAARVSLHKKSEWFCSVHQERAGNHNLNYCNKGLNDPDRKLIDFLAKNHHWTPFAHSRLYVDLTSFPNSERLYFYEHANPAGFVIKRIKKRWFIKGSLYSFATQLNAFINNKTRDCIADSIFTKYPISGKALLGDIHRESYPSFVSLGGCMSLDEDYIALLAKNNASMYNILSATLLLKVPIFIARQVRTSQVGLAYSDFYVEGESFVYNEVSRRYVNDKPEFYTIKEWRVREGSNVKQGSTGLAEDQKGFSDAYKEAMYEDRNQYETWTTQFHIAPEQARVLLPQSMYTEFYMTGTLHRWRQWLALRLAPEVQEETRICAQMVLETLREAFPGWASALSS